VVSTKTGIQNTNLLTLSVTPGPGKVHPVSSSTFERFFKSLLPVRPLLLGLLLSLLILPGLSAQWLTGFGFRKEITIPPTSISGFGTHTNFPVLIDITHDDLRSVSNGGLVVSELGWDIVFSDADGSTQLNHETESYDPSSGRIVAWVQVPSLDGVAGNDIYVYFTNPSPVDQSTPDTWDPNAYVAVYHLEESGPFPDATGLNPDATNSGSFDLNALIEDGHNFRVSDTDDAVEMGALDIPTNALTISAWIRPSSLTVADARIISKANGTGPNDHWWMLSANNFDELRFRLKTDVGGTTTYLTGVSSLSTGNWQLVAATWDGSMMELFHNMGFVPAGGQAKAGNIVQDPSIDAAIGNQPASGAYQSKAFDGRMDEVRIQKVARSEGWLQTEYTNQLNPTSFYSTIGATEIINDDPCDAIELTVEECYTPLVFTNYSASGSGVPNPGCGNYTGGDVWFKVTVPASGKVVVEIDTDATGQSQVWAYRLQHAIYSGGCGSPAIITCNSNNSYLLPGRGSRSVLDGLTPGSELLIRVWEHSNNDNGFFRIGVFWDDTDPTLSVPADISIACNESQDPSNTGDVTNGDISDLCSPDSDLRVSYIDASTQTSDGSCTDYSYTITRTWKVVMSV